MGELAVATGFEPVSLGRKPKMMVHYTTQPLSEIGAILFCYFHLPISFYTWFTSLGDVGRENPLALTTGFQPRTS